MTKMAASLLFAGMALSTLAHGQGSLFQQAAELHAYAYKASFRDFPFDAMWAGTCVFASNPNYAYSGAAHFLYQQSYPNQPPQMFVLTRFAQPAALDYSSLGRHQAYQLQQDARRYIPMVSPVIGENDPLATGLTFSLQDGSSRVDMNLRTTWQQERALHSLSATCSSMTCQDIHGQVLRYGEVAQYCYFWTDRLNGN